MYIAYIYTLYICAFSIVVIGLYLYKHAFELATYDKYSKEKQKKRENKGNMLIKVGNESWGKYTETTSR